ncbi:MAG: glycine/betaine/sarcosine/D-proline family reductase selenoprotein B [SAR202 cluster bacterium]|nr:glycine/betaine/sarcosine/D-proline family reductase selenoprotein B [SAR202 cluster bacterium]
MRVVHYVNQFFGGIGGEEAAGLALESRDGAVGPGRLLEQVLGDGSQVVVTLICGDNYAVEHQDRVTADVVKLVRDADADLFVAGPCFEAGRYGMAAGALCTAVQAELGIPAVAAMDEESPGVDLYREGLYIIDSGANAGAMRDVLAKMARLAQKLVDGQDIGSPDDEGYLRRGLIRDEFTDQTAAERLVDMLMAKAKGEPFESEMTSTSFEPTPMPAGVADITKARIMVITDGGLVPNGNPDNIERVAATTWGSYSMADKNELKGDDYEIYHGGYDPRFVEEDPNRLVPLDALRELEAEGAIGELHNEFISTSGLVNPLANTRRMGKEMVEKVKEEGVDAVILTST